MLTTDDKEEIKRLVGEVIAGLQPSSSAEHKYAQEIEHIDALQNFIAGLRDLVFQRGIHGADIHQSRNWREESSEGLGGA